MVCTIKSQEIDVIEWDHKLYGSDIDWIIRQRDGLKKLKENLELEMLEREEELEKIHSERQDAELIPIDDTICKVEDQLQEIEDRLCELGVIYE
jgi:ribosome assembly protein YihI (activator of Der GTPase)